MRPLSTVNAATAAETAVLVVRAAALAALEAVLLLAFAGELGVVGETDPIGPAFTLAAAVPATPPEGRCMSSQECLKSQYSLWIPQKKKKQKQKQKQKEKRKKKKNRISTDREIGKEHKL